MLNGNEISFFSLDSNDAGGYKKKKKITLENRITGWRRAIIAVGRETSQGFVTAAAPTYLPNDRAFGMKRTKRLCNTCFCWYSYIYTKRRIDFLNLLFYLEN